MRISYKLHRNASRRWSANPAETGRLNGPCEKVRSGSFRPGRSGGEARSVPLRSAAGPGRLGGPGSLCVAPRRRAAG